MKAVVAAFNQEKALVGAFSVIKNLRMDHFEALLSRPSQPVFHGGRQVTAGCIPPSFGYVLQTEATNKQHTAQPHPACFFRVLSPDICCTHLRGKQTHNNKFHLIAQLLS